jgi:hypothetical protein
VGAHICRDGSCGARTGVATEDELEGLLEEMREIAEDERVLIAQACLPGVVAVK